MTCPFCAALVNFSAEWQSTTIPQRLSRYETDNSSIELLRCNNEACRMLIVGVFDRFGGLNDYWPRAAMGKDFPDVPEQLAATASEAHACLSIGAARGAVALARAVTEALAKDNGQTKGSLMDKIDALATAGTISNAMKDAAHEVRFAGNEVAHGDLVDQPLSAEDAEEVVALMDAILLRVYQEPAQVARVRERRESRKV
jgi:hypothetical protein